MKLTIIFKEEFEEHMKKQFGHFTNPQVYGVKSVHMEGGYLCSTIWDTKRWSMHDISRFYCEENLCDLMGGFEYAPSCETVMFQCPHCGQPIKSDKAIDMEQSEAEAALAQKGDPEQ